MADAGTRSILGYESLDASMYRGTDVPFLSSLEPGTGSLPVPTARETMRVLPKSRVDFGKTVTFEVEQREVLLGKQTLSLVLPQLTVYSRSSGNYVPFRWPNMPICAIVESVQFEVNGFTVDSVTGEHLFVKTETTYPTSSHYETVRAQAGEDNSSGKYLTTMFDAAAIAADSAKRVKGSKRLYLPLDFWFGDGPEHEFPNIGDIRFRVKFRPLTSIVKVSGGINADTVISTTVGTEVTPELSEAEILVETRWVSAATARRIISEPRKVPLRQHFTITLNTAIDGGLITARTEYIPRPVKSIFWVVQDESSLRNMGNDYFKYVDSSGNDLMLTASVFSGASRIQEVMPAEHFNAYVPTMHGLRVPMTGIHMVHVSDVPVDVSSGNVGRSLGLKMTTLEGVGDLSARIFTDMFTYFTVDTSGISFDALL